MLGYNGRLQGMPIDIVMSVDRSRVTFPHQCTSDELYNAFVRLVDAEELVSGMDKSEMDMPYGNHLGDISHMLYVPKPKEGWGSTVSDPYSKTVIFVVNKHGIRTPMDLKEGDIQIAELISRQPVHLDKQKTTKFEYLSWPSETLMFHNTIIPRAFSRLSRARFYIVWGHPAKVHAQTHLYKEKHEISLDAAVFGAQSLELCVRRNESGDIIGLVFFVPHPAYICYAGACVPAAVFMNHIINACAVRGRSRTTVQHGFLRTYMAMQGIHGRVTLAWLAHMNDTPRVAIEAIAWTISDRAGVNNKSLSTTMAADIDLKDIDEVLRVNILAFRPSRPEFEDVTPMLCVKLFVCFVMIGISAYTGPIPIASLLDTRSISDSELLAKVQKRTSTRTDRSQSYIVQWLSRKAWQSLDEKKASELKREKAIRQSKFGFQKMQNCVPRPRRVRGGTC